MGHRFRSTSDKREDEPRVEEGAIIRKLHLSGVFLLNDLCGYSYQAAQKEEERQIVQNFCDALVRLAR
jgi:hypothetical protein